MNIARATKWVFAAAALSSAPVVALGCHRRVASHDQGAPAPLASVISLGIEIGTCSTDAETCERECDEGSADRCRRLGMSYLFGKGVAKDEGRGTAFLEKACKMNDPSACLFSGQMYEYSRGVAKDDAKAAKYYAASCDLKWVGGCYNLAVMYEQGRGVEADVVKAEEHYVRACAAGSTIACGKVKEMAEAKQLSALPSFDGGAPF